MIYLTILIFPVEKKKEETVYVIPTKLETATKIIITQRKIQYYN